MTILELMINRQAGRSIASIVFQNCGGKWVIKFAVLMFCVAKVFGRFRV